MRKTLNVAATEVAPEPPGGGGGEGVVVVFPGGGLAVGPDEDDPTVTDTFWPELQWELYVQMK